MIWRFLLLLLISAHAMAEPVSVDLQKMKIPDLVSLVYGEILKRSYVMDSAVLESEDLVTVSIHDLSPQTIDQETRKLLEGHGFTVESTKTVLRFRKRNETKEEESDEIFVYRPLNRSVAYLLDVASGLFKPGAFTSQRRGSGVNLAQVAGTEADKGAALPTRVAEQGVNASADRDVDVLVFHGSPKDVERLKSLLVQVDLPAGEVLVKAVVYEVQITKKDGSAVDVAASILSGKLGLKISGGAAAAGSSVSFKLPIGGLLDLSAVYAAISSDDRFKLVTSPQVRVKSGTSARFSVGNETPVLGAVSLDSNGRATQSVGYKPSGVIFDISPTVREGGAEVNVSQQLSQFVPTTTGVNSSPTLIKRELSTQIVAHDDEIVMLGGLDEERSSVNDSGLSFFPSWLRSKATEGQHTEVVLLLHIQRL